MQQEKLQEINQNSSDFDHRKFDRVLKKHVKHGKVNYTALKHDEEFSAYLQDLEQADLSVFQSREEKVAFWINAYNAYTLKLILDNYPIKSIKDLSFLGTLIINSPWKKRFCAVAGNVYTLDEIEHDILRGELQETGVHFAVVCASNSCPILRDEAYSAKKLKEQLTSQTEAFLSDTLKNQFKWEGKTLYLSKIFDWYKSDFEKQYGSVTGFLAQYFTGEQKEWLAKGDVKIEYLEYDWRLNELK
ncbi:protein of unknown function DUF547 [Chloroherpeton thalassium ATCC 35110]|uniref:DUF547 domain-containing protein n=1 Tax=Chloroherpeton thalassium (strain ATCC 35110 / GB-78) TaxID=517418 RepID=B3QVD3_CHLT3|nr:DUF547 domain-containing protein [Chloroherpeton thalassium]ACF14533.1 protein of unknown function DUF547 [Chloroherpeton thalassium ATCC 35110]